jgi:hypothetical protein
MMVIKTWCYYCFHKGSFNDILNVVYLQISYLVHDIFCL